MDRSRRESGAAAQGEPLRWVHAEQGARGDVAFVTRSGAILQVQFWPQGRRLASTSTSPSCWVDGQLRLI